MKKKHRLKVEARIALVRSLSLDDLGLPDRLRHKHKLDKSAVNNILTQLKMFFEQDIPALLDETFTERNNNHE